jgi:hypothetical protein
VTRHSPPVPCGVRHRARRIGELPVLAASAIMTALLAGCASSATIGPSAPPAQSPAATASPPARGRAHLHLPAARRAAPAVTPPASLHVTGSNGENHTRQPPGAAGIAAGRNRPAGRARQRQDRPGWAAGLPPPHRQRATCQRKPRHEPRSAGCRPPRVQHQPQQLIMRPAHIHRHRPVRPAARHQVHTQLGRLPPPSRAGICHHKHILTPGDESVSPNWTFCTQHTIHPRGSGRWGHSRR